MGTTTASGERNARTPRPEQAALQAQNRLLRAEVVALRQQAHYHRSQHRRAVARAEELQAQVEVLKTKVAELQQRLFGRKSERSNRAPLLGGTEQSGVTRRARGQQPGRVGHGRKQQATLPVVEIVLDLCDSESCAVPTAGWGGTGGVPRTPVNRSNGKCACSGGTRSARSTAARPAANANRSGRTSSRRPWRPR